MSRDVGVDLSEKEQKVRGEVHLELEELTLQSPSEMVGTARELLLEYGNFVASQPGVATFCFGALQEEAAGLPDSYRTKGGGAMLAGIFDPASNSRKWVGFIAWRSLAVPDLTDAWEVKRLWVRPGARRTGAGRRLVEAVVALARSARKTALVLDTAPDAMPAAYRLYLEMGFQPCAAYNGKAAPGIASLRKPLQML